MEIYALTNCVLLDGTEAMQPQTGKAILVRNGKIESIVPQAEIPKEYPLRDLDGQYVLPGLINLHVHLAGSGKPKKKQTDPVKVEKDLTKIIPYEYWGWLAIALILHGRQVCNARKPLCSQCALAHLCPKKGVKIAV